MFDLDGTLVESCDFDSECLVAAVKDVLGVSIDSDWNKYQHVTVSGILNQIIDEYFPGHDREKIKLSVKENFIARIEGYLSRHGASAVEGAAEFLTVLARRNDIVVALATGDWLETARLKLTAANIHLPGIPIASASDHYSRIEIMKKAEGKTGDSQYASKTYFGDGPWDLEASSELGYNFVLVGSRVSHHQRINDFKEVDAALNYIGL